MAKNFFTVKQSPAQQAAFRRLADSVPTILRARRMGLSVADIAYAVRGSTGFNNPITGHGRRLSESTVKQYVGAILRAVK